MKEKFVKALEEFYIGKIGNPLGISRLDYVKDFGGEVIVVTFRNDSQKVVNVTADSIEEMAIDFFRFIENPARYPWLDTESRYTEFLKEAHG